MRQRVPTLDILRKLFTDASKQTYECSGRTILEGVTSTSQAQAQSQVANRMLRHALRFTTIKQSHLLPGNIVRFHSSYIGVPLSNYIRETVKQQISSQGQQLQSQMQNMLRQYQQKRIRALRMEYFVSTPLIISLNNVSSAFAQYYTKTVAFLALEVAYIAFGKVTYNFSAPYPMAEAEILAGEKDSMVSSTGQQAYARLVSLYKFALNFAHFAYLFMLMLPILLTSPMANGSAEMRVLWYKWIRQTLEKAGPAFIKWGQWASSRKDVFPEELCNELKVLCTDAPSHSFQDSKATIESAFGMPIDHVFDHVEEIPLASGSIGQVHRAVLSPAGSAIVGVPAGSTVALKIRHPSVGEAMERDVAYMMGLATVADYIPGLCHLNLQDTMSQFAAPMREQVDLSREAYYLSRFNQNFNDSNLVDFPKPLFPLVAPSIIAESFELGANVDSFMLDTDHQVIKTRLAELGTSIMLKMLLLDNLIHADLHPGNILVRLQQPQSWTGLMLAKVDGLRQQLYTKFNPAIAQPLHNGIPISWYRPHVVLLDTGMAQILSDDDRNTFIQMFRCFVDRDGRGTAKWMLKFAGPEQKCPDEEAFGDAMGKYFSEIVEAESWSTSAVQNAADAWNHAIELVRQHQVNLPGHICAVMITTLVLEGWSSRLDPEFSVLQQVQSMFKAEKKHGITLREMIENGVGSLSDFSRIEQVENRPTNFD